MPALDGLQSFAGGLGVDVFFLLSGFLITAILLREHARTGTIHLKRFYAKRLSRLYPPLILVAIAFTLAWVVTQPDPAEPTIA